MKDSDDKVEENDNDDADILYLMENVDGKMILSCIVSFLIYKVNVEGTNLSSLDRTWQFASCNGLSKVSEISAFDILRGRPLFFCFIQFLA